jgi:hypothetical protein
MKPTLALDFDGVVCDPPFRLNFGIQSGRWDEPLRSSRAKRFPALARIGDRVRYANRTPRAGLREALSELSRSRRIVVITGRPVTLREPMERWLSTHGVDSVISELFLKPEGEPVARHKLETSRRLGIEEFVEDDGRTVRYLADHGLNRVFLVDWPRNRGSYPPSVQVVAGLADVARAIANHDQSPKL